MKGLLIRKVLVPAVWGCICLPVPLHGQGTSPQTVNLSGLQSFLEPLILARMTKDRVPGVVLSVVKDGEVLFAKGYGYADLDARKSADSDKTIFRIASVSKLITATAVMQLAGRGKLRLDDDVNRYLTGFRLPDSFGAAVTVANLLTHTGGFEEQLVGTAARNAEDVLPLAQYLSQRMPARVQAPGELICYSNQGYALLGYVVETVSGMSFEQYVNLNILGPLGMSRSGFSLSPEQYPDLAVGYELRRGAYRKTPGLYLNIFPAAGMAATAADMARFMSAQLPGGARGGVPILEESAIREMQTQHFTNHPRLPGLTWGFYESFYFNRRGLYHAGGLGGYASLLYLMPDQRIGFFIANNGNDQDELWFIVDSFIKHFFPAAPLEANISPDMSARARHFTGSYQHVKHSESTIEKLGTLRSGQVYVSINEDGTLNIYGSRFVEVRPGIYRRIDGYELAAFREDPEGRVTHFFLDQEAHRKLAWYETSLCQQLLLCLFFLSFLLPFFGWSDQAPGWRLDRSGDTGGRPAERVRRLAQVVAALNLIFLAGIAAIFWGTEPGEIWFGLPRILAVWLCIPFLSLVLTLLLPLAAYAAWRDGYWSPRKRAQFSVLAGAAIGFIPYLHHWNLLGFRY